MKFRNPRTEASYQSGVDKVLYKYPKISQIRLSSNPRNFDNFWSIKLKPQRFRGQTPASQMLTDGQTEWGIAIALSQIGWLGAKNRFSREHKNLQKSVL